MPESLTSKGTFTHLNAILPSLILQKPMFFSSLVVNYMWSVSYKSAFAQSTCQQVLSEQQREHSPSASAETEPSAAATTDLQHPLRGIQGGEPGTLSSRKTDGTDLQVDIFRNDFMIPILASLHIASSHDISFS